MTNEVLQKIASDEQNISSSNGLEPKLRFKEFDGKWSRNILGNCCDIIMGQSPDSSSYNNNCIGLPLVQGNADMCERIATPQRYTSQPTKICEAGSIILSVRAPVGTVGKTFQKICLGRGVCGITSKNIEFMYQYLLNNENSWRHIEQGGTFTAINSDDIKSFPIILPSLPEQKKIADFLSLIDQRIEKQRQLVENLKKYKRGLFQYIYCNKSVNWEKKTVKDFSIAYGGYAFDSKLYDKKGFYKIITIGNVTGKRYISTDCNHIKSIPLDLQEHQYLKNGDIVISMTGNVGRVSLVNIDNCLLNQRVAKVIIKDACLKEYMYQVLSASNFEQEMNNRGQGAAQKNIKNSDIENFIFYIPKDYNKVKKISSTLYHLDILIEKTDSILEALIAFKKGLLQQMFI